MFKYSTISFENLPATIHRFKEPLLTGRYIVSKTFMVFTVEKQTRICKEEAGMHRAKDQRRSSAVQLMMQGNAA